MITKNEFLTALNTEIDVQAQLGNNMNTKKYLALRNVKSNFNYIVNTNSSVDTLSAIRSLYKEKMANVQQYQTNNQTALLEQEEAEAKLLKLWIPRPPRATAVIRFLRTQTQIPKTLDSMNAYQQACISKFGQSVDEEIIEYFINL